MFATRTSAVVRRRKKSIMAPSGGVRVVMTILIGISPLVVSVVVSSGCRMVTTMLVGPLVSMLFWAVLRVKVEWTQADHRQSAKGK
jgi:hypothetical protein